MYVHTHALYLLHVHVAFHSKLMYQLICNTHDLSLMACTHVSNVHINNVFHNIMWHAQAC